VGIALALGAACWPAPASATTPGAQRLQFRFGPIDVAPGQNTNTFELDRQMPRVPGYITRFAPNLVRVRDGSVPRVDVLHLHHAVWTVNDDLQFVAGEEKTIASLPRGFGWRSRPDDVWVVNHMIHNQYPSPDRVYITYDIDFVPESSPLARRMRPVRTQWMDVQAKNGYPVFDVLRGSGRRGRFTFPDDDPNAYAPGVRRNEWVVDRPVTLVHSFGHVHPGGLHTDLRVTRDGVRRRLFRSHARYHEPAGPVSWDMSMTTTRPDWRVSLRPGDVVSVSGTYETERADWYESMAIMPVAVLEGDHGVDPFSRKVDRPGRVSHGHLAENRNHGGRPWVLPDARDLLDGPAGCEGASVPIRGFVYGQGDLTGAARAAGRPPVVPRGRPLTFVNQDAERTIYHTITGCREPCNRTSGVAYPLADGRVSFDSGQLGFGPEGLTAAAQRDSWQTPPDLREGTYTYFCRVHPFMRGSFRVK